MGESNGRQGLTTNVCAADAWAERSIELADWAMDRLVNRKDAWGGYRDQADWGREYRKQDGTAGKLGQTTTHKGSLSRHRIIKHFQASSRADIIGMHSTSPENTCLWIAIDIDWHGPTSTAPQINLRAAWAWYGWLVAIGFKVLLVDSNGAGGFHLYVLFSSPVSSELAHGFVKSLISDYAKYGMTAAPETFPKQPTLRPRPDGKPGYGNWLRCPGRHHTRDHWAKVWDGKRWLDGGDAVAFILALRGDHPDLIPEMESSAPTQRQHRAPVVSGNNIDSRVAAYQAKLPNLGEGQGRDDVAYQFASFLGRDLALPDDVALDWLIRWDSKNAPPKGEERLREILVSAHAYGRRAVGSGLVSLATSRQARGKAAQQEDEEPKTTACHGDYHLTDLGNAKRLVDRHGRDMRYVFSWGSWQVWDGSRWTEDKTGEASRRVKWVQAELFQQISRRLQELRDCDEDDKATAERKRLVKLLNHILKWEDARAISRTLDLARSEDGIPILPDQFDTDPMLLNCLNGTLDLTTGSLRSHDREDCLTQLCPTNYNPKAQCPQFLATLKGIFGGDMELVQFVQRHLGYALTGDVREQALPIWWGSGSNGKSTILDAILATIGTDYAGMVPPELLMDSRGDQHPTIMATLHGKRLLVAAETGHGRKINEARLKVLTGGDRIMARRMREDFWQFSPTHKLILVTNHRPSVEGTDHALWRRLRLVPFTNRFLNPTAPENVGKVIPEHLRIDPLLPKKLKAEREGILAWLVRGCLEWQVYGLPCPTAVQLATSEYRSAEDIVGSFLAERCVTGGQDYRIKAGDLYAKYTSWAESAGEKAMTRKRFGDALAEKGFEKFQSNGTWYRGLTVSPISEPEMEGWND